MGKRRKTIPLFKHEDKLLRRLYVDTKIPTDQFERRPDDLANFVEIWNGLAERHDSVDDVLHYMRTKRKQTRRLPEPWPTFDGAHERAPSLNGLLSEHEWEVLREIYERLVLSRELGTDNLGHDEALCDELATSFAKRTRRCIPGLILSAAIMAKRKRKDWCKVGRKEHKQDRGFGDIDEIEA